MEDSFYYMVLLLGLVLLIISLEWSKVRKIDLKTVFVILIILFFLGSAIAGGLSYAGFFS